MNGSLASPTLWAPNEPSGDGKCGSLLKTDRDSVLVRRGWWWNDQSCDNKNGYLCEQQTCKYFKSMHLRVNLKYVAE